MFRLEVSYVVYTLCRMSSIFLYYFNYHYFSTWRNESWFEIIKLVLLIQEKRAYKKDKLKAHNFYHDFFYHGCDGFIQFRFFVPCQTHFLSIIFKERSSSMKLFVLHSLTQGCNRFFYFGQVYSSNIALWY